MAHPGDTVTDAEKLGWRQKAEDYITEETKNNDTEEDPVIRRKPPDRIASYDHAVAEDSQLRCAGLEGLIQFVPCNAQDKLPLLQKPVFVRLTDQASPCEASKWFAFEATVRIPLRAV